MRLLIVADGRSPTTQGWIKMLKPLDAEIFLISTFPCAVVEGIKECWVLPVALGSLAGSQVSSGSHTAQKKSITKQLISLLRPVLVGSRYLMGPITIPTYKKAFLDIIRKANPDIVHALRIPFEGMLASILLDDIPLIASIWGNDLSLHAGGSNSMARWTRRVLTRVNGLMADTHRDIQLANEWRFNSGKPTLVVPGGGGIDLNKINQDYPLSDEILKLLPSSGTMIINPRGLRPGSINVAVSLKAARQVIDENPGVHFLCAAMAGQTEALGWVKKLGLQSRVHLLPYLSQEQLWTLFKRCPISLSVSMHDGTPNTLLEAMALGCLPICGDIPSIREWIDHGENGLLVPPTDHEALARAIQTGLREDGFRKKCSEINKSIISERAETRKVFQQVAVFYDQIINIKV